MAWNKDPEGLVTHHDGDQLVHQVRTTQACKLGGVLEFFDGRRYRYCSTDSDITISDIVVTTNNVQAIAATYFGVLAATAPAAGGGGAIGDTVIDFTTDVTGVTLDEFAGGYLVITTATGKGVIVRVRGNDASPSAGHAHIYLYRNDPLPIALANDSVGALIISPFANVVTHTAADFGGDQNQVVVGRAGMTTTAGTDTTKEFFWVQVAGVGALDSGTAAQKQGCNVSPGEAVNGSVQKPVEADGDANYQACGVAMEDTSNALAFLAIITSSLR